MSSELDLEEEEKKKESEIGNDDGPRELLWPVSERRRGRGRSQREKGRERAELTRRVDRRQREERETNFSFFSDVRINLEALGLGRGGS